jgi:uncharacterized membrane protein YraQ (UPF0718 family)
MERFFQVLIAYTVDILPALVAGFLASGVVHELIPEKAVFERLGRGGIRPVLYTTVVGTLLPICCWGSLPIAVSLRQKGAKLGPILAFLVTTPATSVSALIVAYSIMGFHFAIYIFFAVIAMGLAVGLLGNGLRVPASPAAAEGEACGPGCCAATVSLNVKKPLSEKVKATLRYSFITLPKDIGLEIIIGMILAALVDSVMPIRHLIGNYLHGWSGYVFSVVFGVLTYLCSTASVPLVHSLVNQGLSPGAGMTLLLIGPVTSYGTLLILRKEFGSKVLAVFLIFLVITSVLLGLGFELYAL